MAGRGPPPLLLVPEAALSQRNGGSDKTAARHLQDHAPAKRHADGSGAFETLGADEVGDRTGDAP